MLTEEEVASRQAEALLERVDELESEASAYEAQAAHVRRYAQDFREQADALIRRLSVRLQGEL